MSPHLHEVIRARAESEGLSLNEMSRRLIVAGLEANRMFGELQDKIISKAKELYGRDFLGLVLFGSVSRGEAVAGSDVDLLIVLEENIPIRRELYRPWDGGLQDPISVHIVGMIRTPSQAGSLWLECALDGKVLHDPSGRVGRMLYAIRELITSGKVVRKTTHGQGYWVYV